MLNSIDISTSGLVAQRHRIDTIAGNIANAKTTRDADNNIAPYQRRFVTFSEANNGRQSRGSQVQFQVEVDEQAKPRAVYEPAHPDADADGIVRFPAINVFDEFVNLLDATRAYEANVAVVELSREMAETSIRILA